MANNESANVTQLADVLVQGRVPAFAFAEAPAGPVEEVVVAVGPIAAKLSLIRALPKALRFTIITNLTT